MPADLTRPPLKTEPTGARVTRLDGLDTLEVSLVRAAANGRPFAVRKAATVEVVPMPAAPAAPAPAEKQEIEVVLPPPPTPPVEPPPAEKPTEPAAKAEACKGCGAPMDPAHKFCPACGLGAGMEPAEKVAEKATPGPADVHVPATMEPEEVAKAAMPAHVRKAFDALVAKAATLEGEIRKARHTEARREFVAKAAQFRHAGGAPEELGALLHDLTDAAPALAARVEALVAKADAALAKSNLFVEVGKSAQGEASGTPTARLEAGAKKLAGERNLPVAKAYSEFLKTPEGKAAYADYNREATAQR